MTAAHLLGGLEPDAVGFVAIRCNGCTWRDSFPDNETAIDALIEHAVGEVRESGPFLMGEPHARALAALDELQAALEDMPWTLPNFAGATVSHIDSLRAAVRRVEAVHREREP